MSEEGQSESPMSSSLSRKDEEVVAPKGRAMSNDSAYEIRRTDSLASLRALAQLIDTRSGYYEEVRMSGEDLRALPSLSLRAFYEDQNEVLDGWREVDEVLESQFPTEVMRRFAHPHPQSYGTIHGFESHHGLNLRKEYPHRHPEDHEDGCVTDDDEYLDDHPFSQHSMRRTRRISERALSHMAGVMASRGSRADLATESLQDLSTSAVLSESLRDRPSLADLLEHPEGDDDTASDSQALAHSRTRPVKVQQSRSTLRHLLATNPAMQSPRREPSPAEAEITRHEALPAASLVAGRSAGEVWTKADHERDQLLQNVPTHQRKQDDDAFVKLYINMNLLVNLLLVAGKVVAVFYSNSVSLLASLVDSALDLVCTVVIFMTSRASAYRSWHTFYKYPVGKRRLEPLGVLIFSVLMVVSFGQVLLESLDRIYADVIKSETVKDPSLPWIGVVFMLLTIVIKTFMWFMCHNHKNSSVRAIAQDSENDVMFNIVSLVFPAIGQYLGWRLLDPIGGGLLSLYIISEWVSTLADTTSKLTGKVASAQDVSRCLYLVSRFSLVQAISGFEMYHVGDTMVAEVDVVLPMSFKLKEAHDVGEIITYCIESLTGIERAYIHLDYNPAGQSGHIGQRG
ncbi:hypothetical protein MEQU1_000370 [Malassezia equina]|uniref:Cation efflux protein transmembrane domain-containing protein n=1 Tax=Malassezia equina TaxID=1381935 RepID=A0AAF0J275_9BASI|nr:hypothetical protein MEQU1_000370 [Malassezia equina]